MSAQIELSRGHRGPRAEHALPVPFFPVAIVGGGPGGLAVISALDQSGVLPKFLDRGLVVFDKQNLGGSLRFYNIQSNSKGVELLPVTGSLLTPATDTHIINDLRVDHPVPLPLVGQALDYFGTQVEQLINESRTSQVVHDDVSYIVYAGPPPHEYKSGDATTYTYVGKNGQTLAVSNALILANGAQEYIHLPESSSSFKKTILAGDIIRGQEDELEKIWEKVLATPTQKIHVKAASHSSISAIHKLLAYADKHQIDIPEETIIIHHRDEVRIFYDTAQQAQEAGEIVTAEKVCAKTGRYRRFGGLRNEAAELARKIKFGQEKRAIFIQEAEDLSRKEYPDASIIIEGFGPTTNIIPIFDTSGKILAQKIDIAGQGHTQIDRQARILIEDGTASGTPLPNAWGQGIGYGIRTPFEGEAAHKGAVDGVNVYFEYSGRLIANQLTEQQRER